MKIFLATLASGTTTIPVQVEGENVYDSYQ
jgi:hypothetical protein